jgi:hypothetical protein
MSNNASQHPFPEPPASTDFLPRRNRHRYIVFFSLLAAVIAKNGIAGSDPAPLDTDPFILITELSKLGLFEVNDKIWDFHGQMTYISSSKPAFPAAYTNFGGTPHSLLPETERSFSGTVTFYVGLKA